MSKTIIQSNPNFKKEKKSSDILEVAEFFFDTIQGEGINIGVPASFLRLQHCTQSCIWCDSMSVWRYGNPYEFNELFQLMEEVGLIEKFKNGQHLVLTGGSPVRQQDRLINFLGQFVSKYGFKPYIEIENECTILPKQELIRYIDCWNNSPKLRLSGNIDVVRYQPNIIKFISTLDNVWFKFVIANEDDWKEIQKDFLDVRLIQKHQIILMPLGATREELFLNREVVLDIAIRENVRYSTREHIVIWDKMTGV